MKDHGDERISLARMFANGQASIPTLRRGQLFNELEERQLTAQEEDIIAKRLELQRRMFAAYEAREQERQVEAVLEVSPDLNRAEAMYALQQYRNREDEAIAAIISSPSFKRQIRAACRIPTSRAADSKLQVSAEAHGGTNLPEVPVCTSKGRRSVRRSERRAVESPCQPGTPDASPTSARLPEASPAGREGAKMNTHAASDDARYGSSRGQQFCALKQAVEGGNATNRALTRELHCNAVASVLDISGPDQAAETTLIEQCRTEQDDMTPIAADAETRPPANSPSDFPPCHSDPDCDDKAAHLKAETEVSACRQLHPPSERLQTGQLANSAAQASASSPPISGRPSRRASQGVAQLLQKLRDAPRVQQELARAAKAAAAMRERAREAAAVAAGKEETIRNKRAKKAKRREGETIGNEARNETDAPAKKPRLGRVKKCSSKQVELVRLGRLRLAEGWVNRGYIFPDGYVARTTFRSSVDPDDSCRHECRILGRQGCFWPLPTFQILAADTLAPIDAKSATGAWSGVLARINAAIKARGEVPPGTAIPGPEFFGLTRPDIVEAIEKLDAEHSCTLYWRGKQDRQAYSLLHGTAPERKGITRTSGPARSPRPYSVRRPRVDIMMEEDGDDTIYAASEESDGGGSASEHDGAVVSRWSGVDRAARFRRRHGDLPPDGSDELDNPLPGVLDPVTLEQVQRPAMSPISGHVMGLATWAAVLAEHGRCPFTQQALHKEQLTVLTPSNIERFRDRLITQ